MKLNEVIKKTDLSKKAINYYVEQGLVTPSILANGYREFSEIDLHKLKKISLLRKLKLPIQDIKICLVNEIKAKEVLQEYSSKLTEQQILLDYQKQLLARLNRNNVGAYVKMEMRNNNIELPENPLEIGYRPKRNLLESGVIGAAFLIFLGGMSFFSSYTYITQMIEHFGLYVSKEIINFLAFFVIIIIGIMFICLSVDERYISFSKTQINYILPCQNFSERLHRIVAIIGNKDISVRRNYNEIIDAELIWNKTMQVKMMKGDIAALERISLHIHFDDGYILKVADLINAANKTVTSRLLKVTKYLEYHQVPIFDKYQIILAMQNTTNETITDYLQQFKEVI